MKELIKASKEAMNNSYSPYSNFKVGASLLLKDGTILKGCNVENASYGLSNCAERTVLFTAYAQGIRKNDIVAFAICGNTNNPISPCGACRQVLNELINKDTPIYLSNNKGDVKETNIKELLPYSFDEVE